MPFTFQIPEPCHVPGYTGHVPQYKYHVGHSFSRATHDVIVDPVTPGSGRTPLTNYDLEGYDIKDYDEKWAKVANRDASWGDQKLTENMVVGYTGFVPKLEQQPGKHYAEACVKAIADFMTDQEAYSAKQKALEDQMQRQVPLKQTAADMAPYDSPQTKTQHWRRPYDMDNNEAMKFQVSGYTGHVPCTRDLPGLNYPVGTHVGLNKFHDRKRAHDALRGTDVDLNAPQIVTTHTRKIFRENAGSIPGYTGVVPGLKYKHGRTYGHATKGAKPSVPVLVGDESPEEEGNGRVGGKAGSGGSGGNGGGCGLKGGAIKGGREGAGEEGAVKSRLWQKGDDPYCVEVILEN